MWQKMNFCLEITGLALLGNFPLILHLKRKGLFSWKVLKIGVGTELRSNIRVGGGLPRSLEDLGRADCQSLKTMGSSHILMKIRLLVTNKALRPCNFLRVYCVK